MIVRTRSSGWACTGNLQFAGPHLDGTGLRFETMEHGGKYPDTMPQAIKLIDAEGRSCIYVPITQDGKVVDSQGFVLDAEDE
jgi:hypothetical protein